MKKTICATMVSVLLMSILTTAIVAKENHNASNVYSIYDTSVTNVTKESVRLLYNEDFPLEDNSTLFHLYEQGESVSGVTLKVVIVVLKWVVGNIAWQYATYLYNYEPDYTAVLRWAEENNADPSDLEVVSTTAIYDNGCYSQWFPNNPFCKFVLRKG